MSVSYGLKIVAAVCFGLATFSVPIPLVNLVALGLTFWVVSELL